MLFMKPWPFCLSINVLTHWDLVVYELNLEMAAVYEYEYPFLGCEQQSISSHFSDVIMG